MKYVGTNSGLQSARRWDVLGLLLALLLFGATPAQAATLTVTKTADTNDGACDADCSLREAINAANASPGPDSIDFHPSVTGTITLSAPLPHVTGNLAITGPGAATLSVDANQTGNVLVVDNYATAAIGGLTLTGGSSTGVLNNNNAKLTLTGVVISGNSDVNGGGGIATEGNSTLTVVDSTVRGNHATWGGGISAFHANVTITGSTVSGNAAASSAGGITSASGTLKLTNVTVSSNTASGGPGGGVLSTGATVLLTNVTVIGNSATGTGGGVYSSGGTTKLANTIVTGNTGNSECGGAGPYTSLGHNLLGPSCSIPLAAGDLAGTNPMLGPLQNNGGPTETHALLAGSPAIDAGDSIGCPGTDQRSVVRPQGAACDIGAYEAISLTPTLTPTRTPTRTPIVKSEICGIKFNDLNGNGMYEPQLGEQGLAGWTINLVFGTPPNVVDLQATTDASGNYCFTGLAPGTYTVSEILLPGWTQTFPAPPGKYAVTVPPSVRNINFGNKVVCVGDCDGDGVVSINEIILMVNIALGNLPASACTAGDANHDGSITVNEIITAVNNALNGCPCGFVGPRMCGGPCPNLTDVCQPLPDDSGCVCRPGGPIPTSTATTPSTPTPTPTRTPTASFTATHTPSFTRTPSATVTSTRTPNATITPTATACVPPPPNMVAWWPLDEPAGATTVVDIGLPPANNGVPQPGPISALAGGPHAVPGNLVTTPPDSALLFYQLPTYVEVPSSNDLNLANSTLTIDAWIRPTEVHPVLPGVVEIVEPIVDKLGSGNSGYALYLQITATCTACTPVPPSPPGTQQGVAMHLMFALGTSFYQSSAIYTGTFGVNPQSPITPAWPGWMHVAVTIDRATGNVGTFYLDGNLAGGFSPVVGNNSNTPLWIGGTRLVPTPIALHGEIEINELEIFNTPLSQTQIQSIAGTNAGKCKGTPAATATVTVSPTPSPSATVTRTPTPIPRPTSSLTPSTSPTRTPPATATATRTPTITPTATATCIVPPTDMVAWWTADNTTNDLSGNGNHGTLHGAASYTAGMVGAAFSLPTIADYVDVPDDPTLNFSGSFSIDAWINTVNAPSARATILDKRVGPDNTPVGYSFFIFQGHLGFQIADGQPFLNNVSPSPLVNDGSWHHVAATINRTSTTGGNLYVDGQVIYTFDPTTRPGSIVNSGKLRLGVREIGSPQTFENFQGAIDEVELFNRVLMPQEVHALSDARSSGKCKTPLPTRTPSATVTRTPTRTSTYTSTPSFTTTPRPTNTPTRTPTPSFTRTPSRTIIPTRTTTRTATATSTALPTRTVTSSPTPTSPCGEPHSLLVSTGNASIGGNDPIWSLVGAPAGIPNFPPARPAVVIGAYGGWSTLSNTQWITADTVCGHTSGCPAGTYEYEVCWEQCGELVDPAPFMALADNQASVFLDNNFVVAVPGFSVPTSFSFNAGPGTHSLRVDVVNALFSGVQTPTGLDLSGILNGQIQIVQCQVRPPTFTPTPTTGTGTPTRTPTRTSTPTSTASVTPGCPGGMCTPTPTRTATPVSGGSNITVLKNTVPDGPQDFTFTATGGLVPSTFMLDDDNDPTLPNAQTFTNVPAGTYTITETVPPGWMVTSIGCVGAIGVSTGVSSATITVQAGANVTCTFKNEPRPTPTVTPTRIVTPTPSSTPTRTANVPPPG